MNMEKDKYFNLSEKMKESIEYYGEIKKIQDNLLNNSTQLLESYIELLTMNNYLKEKNQQLTEEIESLKKDKDIKPIINPDKPKWNECILSVCKDGKQRTAREIFNEIDKLEIKPWSDSAKTPDQTCSAACGHLFFKDILVRTNDDPIKYFMYLK